MRPVAFILNNTVLRSHQMIQTQNLLNFSQYSLTFLNTLLFSILSIQVNIQYHLRFLLPADILPCSLSISLMVLTFLNFLLLAPKDRCNPKFSSHNSPIKCNIVCLNFIRCHNINHHLHTKDFQI